MKNQNHINFKQKKPAFTLGGKCPRRLKKVAFVLGDWGKSCRRLKKAAFTLAEVLIVLGIIGVVAAFTIPVLIKNIQKEETLIKLKASYTQLYQTIKLSEVDNGPTSEWDRIKPRDSDELLSWFNTYLAKYLKYTKVEKYTYDSNLRWTGGIFVYLNN